MEFPEVSTCGSWRCQLWPLLRRYSPFGRRVHVPGISASNPSRRAYAERAAINAPMQGSAADIIRRAMIRMPSALAEAGLSEVKMLLQVHDELVFEAPDALVEQALPIITRTMSGAASPAVSLAVPLTVDISAAQNWEAAH